MPHDYVEPEKPAKKAPKPKAAMDAAPDSDESRFSYENASGLILHPSDDPDAETFYL